MASLDELVQMYEPLSLKMDELRVAQQAAGKVMDDLPSDTPQEVMAAAQAAYHQAFGAYNIAFTSFYAVYDRLERCLGCETWELVEATGDWIKDGGWSWCTNCAHSCKGCDRTVCYIDSEGGYCNECRSE